MVRPENTPCVLIIRDGWGENPHTEHDAFNAIKLARTPVADRLMREYPSTLIKTSGEDVGLPEGTMGNSEVGHQNIGAGRIVDQESVAITKACRGGLETNAALSAAIKGARDRGGTVHLLGICSDAGVHGLLDHLYAIVRACKGFGMTRVAVHLFTDGRDTGPFTGKGYAEGVERTLAEIGVGRVASVCGRYWSMDRDYRWERVKRAYDLLTERERDLPRFASAAGAIQDYYDRPSSEGMKGDEFVSPRLVGEPAPVRDGDAVVFFNYRGDRPREISAAFVFPDEKWAQVKASPDSGVRGFERGRRLEVEFVTMTAYWEELAPFVKVAFPKPPKMADIAGAWVSGLGLTQFRCAETEKFPHVTFFFNDYRDEPFEGERREIIQSPRVATYDLQPEMSAAGVRDAVLGRIKAADGEPFIVVNFANGDMVGHTGVLAAAVRACEVVDECVGAIVEATLARGGSLVVTADHGNAEQMFDPATGSPHTAHTTYDVPLIVVGEAFKGRRLRSGGRLADILPTMLEMMGLERPGAMTGRSLLGGGEARAYDRVMDHPRAFIDAVLATLEHQDRLLVGAVEQLSEAQMHERIAPGTNSVAVIVRHLWGNIRSRWTDFLTSDGEKATRDREGEFVDDGATKAEVLARWGEARALMERVVGGLSPDDLLRTVTIRGQAHSVPRAVLRAVDHNAYHIGQVVLVAKVLRGEGWRYLSVPPGGTGAFNASLGYDPGRAG